MLKLVGSGEWSICEWLRDELYLPFVEPLVLQHGKEIDHDEGPCLTREEPREYKKLALKWNEHGLLAPVKDPHVSASFTRIFNAFKSAEHDRQIGDRRLANATELPVQGPSSTCQAGSLSPTSTFPEAW